MAKTVEEGFRAFHGRLTPTGGESAAAKRHRASIEASLKSNFEITRFFRTGSVGNGTSIRRFSDVDYFASIPSKHLRQNSGTMLQAVRGALGARFPTTVVVVRTPAVLVPFGTVASETTEVVPVSLSGRTNAGRLIYNIANGAGGWMKSSPDAHNAYVASIDNKLGKKVKPLVRFLKAWKYYRSVPISSFYLELRIAKYASLENSIFYSIDVRNILKMLWDTRLAAMQDPMGISGYIYASSTDARKSDALSKLSTALIRAQKARDAQEADKIPEAFYWWNLMFADQFPAYS